MEESKGSVWYQRTVTLKSRSAGNYDVTKEILKGMPEIKDIKIGL